MLFRSQHGDALLPNQAAVASLVRRICRQERVAVLLVAFARALLADPRILILDEATSSVDTETERQIQEALERLIAGRTVFAIAHRLSTLRRASRLLVIADGRLVESGTHEELVAKPEGKYRRLYEMQVELA